MISLEALDLNRVLALHWLLEDAHVTRAARHMGTSQPAMSRTLGELRDWFGDPLLVRAGRSMIRTPLAESLRPRLSAIIAELREIVQPPETFRADTARGSVAIACTDYVAGLVLEAWNDEIRPRAPDLDLELRSIDLRSFEQLGTGAVDLAVVPSWIRAAGSGFVRRAWLDDRLVSVVRRDHPLAGRHVSLKRFAGLDHVQVVTGTGRPSEVDEALAGRGLERRIALRLGGFLLAALAVSRSDCVATLPGSMVSVAGVELARIHTPLVFPGFTLELVWHTRSTAELRHRFVREALERFGQSKSRTRRQRRSQ